MFTRFLELPFDPDPAALITRLGIDPDSEEAEDFAEFLDSARVLAAPKAVYGEAKIEVADVETGTVSLDGETFTSRLCPKENCPNRQADRDPSLDMM